jgi:hypothetical protein
MHYFFLDESYPPAAEGQKKIVMAAWAVEQRMWNWNANTGNRFDLFETPVLKPICSMLESVNGAAFAAEASLDNSLYRAGEIDSTNDIPAMKRPDLIWSTAAVFVLGTLILKLVQHSREVGTVDIYFDPKNLKWAHTEAWKKTLRDLVVKRAKRFAWERNLGELKKLNIRRIEPVAKAGHLEQESNKFQMGVKIADKFCSNFNELDALKCRQISVLDMSEGVRRTVQQWDGKSFYEGR